MSRPKFKVGDVAIVRNTIYVSPLDRHVVFKLGEKGVVVKVTGDVVHLASEDLIKKINIYNLKKFRKYTRIK